MVGSFPFVFAAACVVYQTACAQHTPPDRLRGGLFWESWVARDANPVWVSDVPGKAWDAPADHFGGEADTNATYRQRYFVDDRHFDAAKGACLA
jgi:hypothetical protein